MLVACNNNNSLPEEAVTEAPSATDNSQNSTLKENVIELPIYTINHDNGIVPTVSLVDKSRTINAELIVNEVIANFDMKIIISSIIENDDNVIIDFSSESAHMHNVSSSTEESVLDAIAYSLLDNLDKCEKIYYRINDSKYNSDNIDIAIDEPYVTR